MNLWLAVASSKALSTSWQTFQPGTSAETSAASAIPTRARLESVVIYLDTISGASTVTLAISRDSAGRQGVVPFATTSATQTISDLGSGYGYVSWSLSAFPWIAEGSETPYVRVKLDAGTANGVVRLVSST